MLVDLYRQGHPDLDAFVSEKIALDDVENAFEKMRHGAYSLNQISDLE
jgi:S-(hydroxymethyl)mycothiol dehydrogenase